jgi:hypothetical protein
MRFIITLYSVSIHDRLIRQTPSVTKPDDAMRYCISFAVHASKMLNILHTVVQVTSTYQNVSLVFLVSLATMVVQHILITDLFRIQATGTWSSTGEGFQPGYRSLSVFGNGPAVAQYFCRRAGRSLGSAAIRASYAEIGAQVTSTFSPVFASYALKISLNDCSPVAVIRCR